MDGQANRLLELLFFGWRDYSTVIFLNLNLLLYCLDPI